MVVDPILLSRWNQFLQDKESVCRLKGLQLTQNTVIMESTSYKLAPAE